MKIDIVGLKELRENMQKVASQVEQGHSFIVVKKSKPLFKISSIDDDDSLWETVIDLTKVKKGGVSVEALLAKL